MDINDQPLAPKHVFLLDSAAALFQKLHWERNNLQHALAPENYKFPDQTPAYIAFNCAVTAWHIADWTWHTADADQKRALAERMAVPQFKDLHAFYGDLGEVYPELKACRDLANGSKHFCLKRPKGNVSANHAFPRVVDPSGRPGLKRGDFLLDLYVQYNGTNAGAQNFFDRILSIWLELLGPVGLLEPKAVAIDNPVPDWILDL